MPNLVCPHCQQQSIAAKQKLFLTAIKPLRCNNCDALLQTNLFWYGLAATPHVILLFVVLFTKPDELEIFITMLFAISTSLLVHFYAPLTVDRRPLAES